MVDEAAFKDLMGAVCAPVTVVTTLTAEGRPHGTTVSSFASLSLKPAMVTFALDRKSELLSHLQISRKAAVNVLADGQDGVATAFAHRGENKFDGVDWHIDEGLPRLNGIGGWMVVSVRELIDGGDHLLVIATADRADSTDAPPLIYARRTFGTHSLLAHHPQSSYVNALNL